jgi:hypothetical protein
MKFIEFLDENRTSFEKNVLAPWCAVQHNTSPNELTRIKNTFAMDLIVRWRPALFEMAEAKDGGSRVLVFTESDEVIRLKVTSGDVYQAMYASGVDRLTNPGPVKALYNQGKNPYKKYNLLEDKQKAALKDIQDRYHVLLTMCPYGYGAVLTTNIPPEALLPKDAEVTAHVLNITYDVCEKFVEPPKIDIEDRSIDVLAKIHDLLYGLAMASPNLPVVRSAELGPPPLDSKTRREVEQAAKPPHQRTPLYEYYEQMIGCKAKFMDLEVPDDEDWLIDVEYVVNEVLIPIVRKLHPGMDQGVIVNRFRDLLVEYLENEKAEELAR